MIFFSKIVSVKAEIVSKSLKFQYNVSLFTSFSVMFTILYINVRMERLKVDDFCQKFIGREGGQHDQHFVKNKFVKNRVGGREVNLNLDNVHKYTVFFWRLPLRCIFFLS